MKNFYVKIGVLFLCFLIGNGSTTLVLLKLLKNLLLKKDEPLPVNNEESKCTHLDLKDCSGKI